MTISIYAMIISRSIITQSEDMTMSTSMVSSMGAAMAAVRMREPMSEATVNEVLRRSRPLTKNSSYMTLTNVPRLISNTLWNLMSLKDTREELSVTIETHAISRCIPNGLSIVMSSIREDTSILRPITMVMNLKSTMILLNQFTEMIIILKSNTTMTIYLCGIVILKITTLKRCLRPTIFTQNDHKLSLSLQFTKLSIPPFCPIGLKLCHTMTWISVMTPLQPMTLTPGLSQFQHPKSKLRSGLSRINEILRASKTKVRPRPKPKRLRRRSRRRNRRSRRNMLVEV